MDLDTFQEDTLRKFLEITNGQDKDMAVCTLASLDWNLERAIETHLISEADDELEQIAPPQHESSPVLERPRQIPIERVMDDTFEDFEDNEREDVEMVELARRSARVAAQPSSSTTTTNNYRTTHHDSDDEFDAAFDDEATSHADAAASSRARTNGIPLIPQDSDSVIESQHNFVTVFESRYCSSGNGAFMPCFNVDTLANTFRDAFEAPGRPISERRPVAVYIHNDNSVAANIFPANVMCRDEISTLLRRQFLLWGWDVTLKENFTKLIDWLSLTNLSESRRIFETWRYDKDRFPLLVLLTKEKGTLKIVEVCDGTDAPDQVMTKLLTCVEDYTNIRLNEMHEQQLREERDRLRQEQALEYEASLAADRARREAKEREIREQKEEEERRARAEEEEKQRRTRLEAELPEEPAESDPTAIQVKFRVPEGEQLMRRFRQNEHLSVLYKFLSSKGYAKEQYRFFNSDFPKKDISTWDADSTFSAHKFPRREQIFVEEQ